jgi:hypothetical protein
VEYAVREGIVSGYPDGTFKPENTINRAEFSKIVINALAPKETIDTCLTSAPRTVFFSQNLVFPDVAKSAWFAKFLCTARAKNIINGYPDGTFRPDGTVNAAEGAKILAGAFALTENIPPPDSLNPRWYEPYLRLLTERHAIPLSVQTPESLLTRGELVQIMYRLKENLTALPGAYFEDLVGRERGPCEQENSGVFRSLQEALGVPERVCSLLLGRDVRVGDGEPLEFIPSNIGTFRFVRVLDLTGNNLFSLPREIGDLQQLETLIVGQNTIAQLPQSFARLQGLRHLDLSQNQFSIIPESVMELQSLERLQIDDNPLQFLSKTIGNLRSLRFLSLLRTPIVELPEELFSLQYLSDLRIGGVMLENISDRLGSLQSLHHLTINGQLTSLPGSIGNLTALESLDLRGNQFTAIPPALGKLPKLKELWLTGNPIPSSAVKQFQDAHPGVKVQTRD